MELRTSNNRGAGKGGIAVLLRAGRVWPALPDPCLTANVSQKSRETENSNSALRWPVGLRSDRRHTFPVASRKLPVSSADFFADHLHGRLQYPRPDTASGLRK